MKPSYTYNGSVIRVIDGDTYEVMIDLGFGVHSTQKIRLEGVNTPEKDSKYPEEKELAIKAMMEVRKLFYDYGWKIVLQTRFDMTFARYVASIKVSDIDLAQWLTDNKLLKENIPTGYKDLVR